MKLDEQPLLKTPHLPLPLTMGVVEDAARPRQSLRISARDYVSSLI